MTKLLDFGTMKGEAGSKIVLNLSHSLSLRKPGELAWFVGYLCSRQDKNDFASLHLENTGFMFSLT